MILADKILNLRKKNGWSQEELAAKLNVSRQSVSKWESAQATPDLDRILQLSQIFGVSTDYLIKDEIEEYEITEHDEPMHPVKRVSLELANRFIDHVREKSRPYANAVSIFIMSPIILLILIGLSDERAMNIEESLAMLVGVAVVLICIAIGLAVLIRSGKDGDEFEFLSTESFETEYGVDGLVKTKKSDYKDVHTRRIILGIGVILLAPIILFSGIAVAEQYGEYVMLFFAALLLVFVAIGVNILVRTSMVMESYNILLEEGDYSREKKQESQFMESIATIYWVTITAIFLLSGFVWDAWHINWVVWPIGALMYVVLSNILSLRKKRV